MAVKRKTGPTKKVKPKIKRTSTKITKNQSDKVEKRVNKSDPFKPGDFCYYIDANNKIRFAEVQSTHVHEETGEYFYQMIDQHEYRFLTAHHDHCADDKAELKGIKRK
tara:strand:- start:29 stop:352 length:324 start_codon:yes stop_codon:yes gene_type:complete